MNSPELTTTPRPPAAVLDPPPPRPARFDAASVSDVVGLLEARVAHARDQALAAADALRDHRHQVGPDAWHWFKDLEQQLRATVEACDLARCHEPHCERLAFYAGAGFDRFCDDHSFDAEVL